jgi:L-lactate dehydrogenase (cytochrome)
VNSGSWTETTYNENVSDFQKIKLRQRVAIDMSNRTLETKMIGQKVAMPMAIAPTGLTGMQRADGEILAAQAAEEFGIPYTLSTMSVCSIEAVAEKTKKPFWFQLYVMKDKKFMERLIDRAKAAKCSALVLTLDLQLLGQRHKDIRNGLSTPPKLVPKHIYQVLTRPAWCMRMLTTKNHFFGNIVGHVDGIKDVRSLGSWIGAQFDQQLDWKEVDWIKKRWGGKLIIKGILDAEDALLAAKTGADAIIVSNHGGRQLDGASSTINILPEIVDKVGKLIEVHIDGGIRSGQDVVKAMCLGAKGTYIGRAFLYGLGALGKEGVTKALDIIKTEADMTMALCGRRDVHDLNHDNIYTQK